MWLLNSLNFEAGNWTFAASLYSDKAVFTSDHHHSSALSLLISLFSLTVVDSDGASNSTTANLTVKKAVDYPPVANAGPNQVITLPQNSITLYGNQSTDDHSIVSYEWLLSPNSKGKVMEMQVSAALQCSGWLTSWVFICSNTTVSKCLLESYRANV